MSRSRWMVLLGATAAALGIAVWIGWRAWSASTETFRAGAPPEDLAQMLLPKKLDVASLRPPAILSSDIPRYGGATATIAVIEYGDYQCPECRLQAKTIAQVLPEYNGRVRFVWKDLPLVDQHPEAVPAAAFARCAKAQGLFWEAYDRLISRELGARTYAAISRELGLDAAAMDACRSQPALVGQLTREISAANADGVQGVPLVFIGPKALYGPIDAAKLRAEIAPFLEGAALP